MIFHIQYILQEACWRRAQQLSAIILRTFTPGNTYYIWFLLTYSRKNFEQSTQLRPSKCNVIVINQQCLKIRIRYTRFYFCYKVSIYVILDIIYCNNRLFFFFKVTNKNENIELLILVLIMVIHFDVQFIFQLLQISNNWNFNKNAI